MEEPRSPFFNVDVKLFSTRYFQNTFETDAINHVIHFSFIIR